MEGQTSNNSNFWVGSGVFAYQIVAADGGGCAVFGVCDLSKFILLEDRAERGALNLTQRPKAMTKVKIMTEGRIIGELEAIADKLQIEIRYEPLESRGGLCKVKSKTLIFINEYLPIDEKARIVAEELNRFDAGGMFILPKVREVIETHSVNSV